jgi:hypothetical protein
MSTTSSNLATPDQVSRAWAIRKEVARRWGVKLTFVSFGDCLRKAMGKLVRRIRDRFGNVIGTIGSMINEILTSEDAPLIIDSRGIEWIEDQCGAAYQFINAHMHRLTQKGFVLNHFGYKILKFRA